MVEEWELNCHEAAARALDEQRQRDPLAIAHHDAQLRDRERTNLRTENQKMVASFRAMADWLEQRPEFPVRHINYMPVYPGDIQRPGESAQSAMGRLVRELGMGDKQSDAFAVKVYKPFGTGGVGILAYATHEEICERIVRKEHRTVREPDPVALKAVPTITHEREIEVVEWKCPESLLALREVA